MNLTNRVWMTAMAVALVFSAVNPPLQAANPTATPDHDDVAELAAKIDQHVSRAWQAADVVPAPPADDAEFLRRTYLNLVGCIPPVSVVREFLADTDPDKRRKMVDALLDHPGYVNHFAHTWRLMMMPEGDVDQQARNFVPGFEGWLRDKLIDNAGYDEIARELITCRISGNEFNGPVAFYRAKEVKPENIASSISRLFLGVQLDCAQCHNHPFAKWQQDEFWAFAAFFSGIEGERFGSLVDNMSSHEIRLNGGDTIVPARYIDQTSPKLTAQTQVREVLADWIVRKDNPYFSRTGANRIWAHFFGSGIVDPPDGFDEANPPTHPELLDALAEGFAAHDYDVKFLIRAITASHTYQLSSVKTDSSQSEQRLIGHMPVLGLTPRQLTDSLVQATGVNITTSLRNRMFGGAQIDNQIQSLFENQSEGKVDPQSTILQALALMNCQFVEQQTKPASSNTLAAVLEAPFLDTDGRIETLYLATLSRRPTERELTRLRDYVVSKSGDAPRSATASKSFAEFVKTVGEELVHPSNPGDIGQEQALADVFWALLNSSEFLFNH